MQRRVDLMAAEGIIFQCNSEVGADAAELTDDFDATVLAMGSTVPNNLPIPGRQLEGVIFAMVTPNRTPPRILTPTPTPTLTPTLTPSLTPSLTPTLTPTLTLTLTRGRRATGQLTEPTPNVTHRAYP